MNSCPYCAQSNTRKDEFGYCKKYACFSVSGTKQKFEDLRKQIGNTIFLPTYRRNMFDNSAYNPREEKKSHLIMEIQNLLGFVPLSVLS